MEMVDLIGNTNVMFEFKDIKTCFEMIEKLIKGDYDYREFAMQFLKLYELVEDECPPEELIRIAKSCNKYISRNRLDSDFIQELKSQYISIRRSLQF